MVQSVSTTSSRNSIRPYGFMRVDAFEQFQYAFPVDYYRLGISVVSGSQSQDGCCVFGSKNRRKLFYRMFDFFTLSL